MMNWLTWWLPPVSTFGKAQWALRKHDMVSTEEAAELLEKAGLKVLGYGVYGVVIEEKDYVIKLFSKEDDGYQAFIDLAMSYEGDYLPTIHWVKPLNSKIMAVAIETLDAFCPCDADNNALETFDVLEDVIDAYKPVPDDLNEELTETLHLLKEHQSGLSSHGFYIGSDIHYGNVMMREEHMVITDPWCG